MHMIPSESARISAWNPGALQDLRWWNVIICYICQPFGNAALKDQHILDFNDSHKDAVFIRRHNVAIDEHDKI